MKKIWIFLLICGINLAVFGQVFSGYTIVLNKDTSTLNASLENSNLVYSFKKSDVLTITFTELESATTQKSVVITSNSEEGEVLVGTIYPADMKSGNSYDFPIALDKLPLKSGTDEVYTIRIKDEKAQQNILRFRLL